MRFVAVGKCRRGFTLIEALLAMVVISALVVAMSYILVEGLDSYRIIVDRRESLQQARLAVNMMANELQTISDPSTDISAIAPESITFNGALGPVTYAISGNMLTRTDGDGTSTLADGVTGASGFQYYTSGGGTTVDPTQVYRVGIVLGINAGVASSGDVVIRNNVYLRNRYYEAFTKT